MSDLGILELQLEGRDPEEQVFLPVRRIRSVLAAAERKGARDALDRLKCAFEGLEYGLDLGVGVGLPDAFEQLERLAAEYAEEAADGE